MKETHPHFNRLDVAHGLYKHYLTWGNRYKKDAERWKQKRDTILKELEL
jgi:hypothetical protein